ncbi:MAG: TolC family protein [Gemmatimonadales bacterium]
MTGRNLIRRVRLAVVLAVFPAGLAAQAPAPVPRQLSLDAAIGLSEQSSEAIGIARAGLHRARADVSRAQSGFLPQLTGIASYTRTLKSQFSALQGNSDSSSSSASTPCSKFVPNSGLTLNQRVDSLEAAVACQSGSNPFAAFKDLPFGRPNEYDLGLQGSWTLFNGMQNVADRAGAVAGRRSAEVGLTAERARNLLTVAQAYYDALLAGRLLTIADSTLAQTDRTLSETKLAAQVGNKAEFDLLRAQVARDNQVPVQIQRRAAREVAYLRLKQLLNIPTADSVTLTTALEGPATALPAEVSDFSSDTATSERAGVLQAAAALDQAAARRRAARGLTWPALTLSSTYTRIAYPESGLPSLNSFVTNWSVVLGASVPLFTGGRLSAGRSTAEANLEEAELRLAQARKAAALDALTAATQLSAAEAGWSASEGTVGQAERAYQIAEVRYREGISTQTELSDSRIQLQQAQATRAQAARDLQLARLKMAVLRDLPAGS